MAGQRQGVVHVQRVVREQRGKILADQITLTASGPRGGSAVGVQDAAAAAVDRYLMGDTLLPAPIKPTDRPLV